MDLAVANANSLKRILLHSRMRSSVRSGGWRRGEGRRGCARAERIGWNDVGELLGREEVIFMMVVWT